MSLNSPAPRRRKSAIHKVLLAAIDAGIRMLEYWPREIRKDLWQCPYCHEEGRTADDIKHIVCDDPSDPMSEPDCPVVAQEKAVEMMQTVLKRYGHR